MSLYKLLLLIDVQLWKMHCDLSHLLEAVTDSQHHWDGGAGNVSQLCDHHGNEVGRGHVIH